MYLLKDYEPKKVFKYFEEISYIPRGSGNEKQISDYLVDFAKKRSLFVIQDEALNIIIRKPGTTNYEKSETVILQGHMDMVCEKNNDTIHEFTTDPLKLVIDGEYLRADNTTLGADNGIAMAYALAILDSDDIPHPPLEVIMTTTEEIGMDGAIALEPKDITGKLLINLDSGEEGVLTSSCAGGMKSTVSVPIEYRIKPENFTFYNLSVKGLKGGHSGAEIHKERANSIRILGRLLNTIFNDFDIYMSGISGGMKDNAIPREAEALVCIQKEDGEEILKVIKEMEESLKDEFRVSDPDLYITLDETPHKTDVFTQETFKRIVTAILLIPNGVQAMSMDIEDLVETSNNIGVLRTLEDTIELTCALRSSVIPRKYFIRDQIRLVADAIDATVTERGDYPAWEYNPVSNLRDVCTNVYKELYKEDAVVSATHAGLECGLFSNKIEGLDMVSFGPNIEGAHTPKERLNLPSTIRTWELLKGILKRLI